MTDKQRLWTMEDLLDGHGSIGQAHADARFHGNTSARQAITDLRKAIRGLPDYLDEHAKPDDGPDEAA